MILQQTEYAFDLAGNVVLTHQYERLSDAAGTGLLNFTTAEVSASASWLDGVGRSIATANYGRVASQMTRSDTVPTRSDSILVTTTAYHSQTGRVSSTIDAESRETRSEYDAMGRVKKTIVNYTGDGTLSATAPDENVTTEFVYDISGQMGEMRVKTPENDQITRYIYGTSQTSLAPLVYRNDLLVVELYPDSDDTIENLTLNNGVDGIADRVEFQYNRLGERVWKRDQNGSIHTYEYDHLGRLLSDRVTTLADGVDGTIRMIRTVYTVDGKIDTLTSYDNPTLENANIVNQVKYDYTTQGLLSRERVSHSGAVTDVTPSIAYTYDVSQSNNRYTKSLRPTSFTTPNGTVVGYAYGTSDSLSDQLNRIVGVQNGSTTVAEYAYTGVQNIMGVSYPVAGVSLDYTSVSTRDSFGRVIDHAWKTADETPVVQIQHGYDRGGNRLYRRDMVASAHSELYQYDQMNQLTAMQRGVLNTAGDTVTSKSFEEDFAFDMTGNWLNYKQDANGDGAFEVNQTRTHNLANEILTISGGNTLVSHDRNGCMTKVPKPLDGTTAYTLVYDAWNRLAQVKDDTSVVATYMYDARNHRIKKTVGTVVTLSYFNQNWQEIESIAAGVTTTHVYGIRYIDDIISRTSGSETLYTVQDPNWNVCALVNPSGTVMERITYDSFGKPTFRDASFVAKTASSHNWTKTFTGQVYDVETGLMLYRNRYYHTGLGRFVTRDPVGYDANNVNLYRYV
ncbi:MAG: RHS repeat-associated core domain-containing protein, partial [Thermoguttaceae bacterium]|nr:RHS repeat-associated core domain-containing protein [Thermoguttaceae bacterium]